MKKQPDEFPTIELNGQVYRLPFATLFRPLADEELERLVISIAKHGIQVPIVADENGMILDGHNRLLVARRLRLPASAVPVRVVSGLTPEQKLALARSLNEARRQLTSTARRTLALKLRRQR